MKILAERVSKAEEEVQHYKAKCELDVHLLEKKLTDELHARCDNIKRNLVRSVNNSHDNCIKIHRRLERSVTTLSNVIHLLAEIYPEEIEGYGLLEFDDS